jgi:hypothetical protein
VRLWTQHYPPRECLGFPYVAQSEEAFYVGAELALLGDPERLRRDLYAVEWLGAQAPATVAAGSSFTVRTAIANRSRAAWPSTRPAAVALSYHWVDPAGGPVVWDGLRTALPFDVPPGGELRLDQAVRAPDTPGLYVLMLDPVFEGVAWFSERNGGQVLRLPVEVAAAPGAAGAAHGASPEDARAAAPTAPPAATEP